MGLAHHDGAQQLVGVVGVQRLAGLEHHIVGDVDRQADGAHATGLQAVAHPRRSRGEGVDVVDDQVNEQLTVVRFDTHRVGTLAGLGNAAGVDVVVGHIERLRRFAGQAPHRQAIAHVGGNINVQDLVGHAEQGHRLGAQSGPGGLIGGQHDDAGVVLPDTELIGSADHPVGDVSIGTSRRDLEPAGQLGTGQCHHHVVALGEVVGPTDDAASVGDVGVLIGDVELLSTVHMAPTDGLAVLLGLLDEAHHPTHHDRTGDLVAHEFDVLHLQAGARERVGKLLGGDAMGQLNQGSQPTDRCLHRAPPTNERLKRTSPSTKSRRSGALLRNMTVRSTPMPKANPE